MNSQLNLLRGVVYNDPNSGLCALSVYVELSPGLFKSPRVLLVLESWFIPLLGCPVKFNSLINNSKGVWAKYVASNGMSIRVMINGVNSSSGNNVVFLSKNQADIDKILKEINVPLSNEFSTDYSSPKRSVLNIEHTNCFTDILPTGVAR